METLIENPVVEVIVCARRRAPRRVLLLIDCDIVLMNGRGDLAFQMLCVYSNQSVEHFSLVLWNEACNHSF